MLSSLVSLMSLVSLVSLVPPTVAFRRWRPSRPGDGDTPISIPPYHPHLMVPWVLATIPLGLAIAWPLALMLSRVGHRIGAIDSPGHAGHAKQLRNIPNIGGIAFVAAVTVPMLFFIVGLALAEERVAALVPALAPHLGRLAESLPTAVALVVALVVLHVMGLIDDRRSLPPVPKLAVQIAVAVAMATWFDVRLLTALDGMLPFGPVPSIAVTVIWIVAITNAVNFMDNMDGLAGGVAAVSAALLMAATILNGQWFIAGTLGLLIGGLVGFLFLNFPPAKLFMGDGGSLPLGFLLAVLTARTTYYDPTQLDYPLGGAWYAVFMPLAILAVPIYDLVTVTTLRIRQGKSPLVGDQQHWSHRLVQRGLSRRGAVLIIWAVAAVIGIGGVTLGSLQPWQAALVGVQTILMLALLATLEYASRHAIRD